MCVTDAGGVTHQNDKRFGHSPLDLHISNVRNAAVSESQFDTQTTIRYDTIFENNLLKGDAVNIAMTNARKLRVSFL